MKFNKYALLLGCLVLLLGTSFVCAHDISQSHSCKNNVNMNLIQDLNCSNISDCNNSSDALGIMSVYVYANYNSTTKKFSNPVEGAKCYLYGWKQHGLVNRAHTNAKGECYIYGNPLSRYHLDVLYPNGTVVKCDISKSKDMIYVSPTHCEYKTGQLI